MSSSPTAHPFLRMVLTDRSIELRDSRADETLVMIDLLDPEADRTLASLAARARAEAAEADVVLPESAVARGRLAPDAPVSAAWAQAAQALAAAETDILVTLGEADATGARDWAAVPCEVVCETRIFLSDCGLAAASISAPGALPPFIAAAEAPEAASPARPLTAWRAARRSVAAAGAAAVAVVALLAWPLVTPPSPRPVEISLTSPALDPEFAAAGGGLPGRPVTGTAPRHRPGDLRSAAQPADPQRAAPPTARVMAPEPPAEPRLTLSGRNLPSGTFMAPPVASTGPEPLQGILAAAPAPDTSPPLAFAQVASNSISDLPPPRPQTDAPAADEPPAGSLSAAGAIGRPRARPDAGPSAEAVSASIASAVRAARTEALETQRPLSRSDNVSEALPAPAAVAMAAPTPAATPTRPAPTPPVQMATRTQPQIPVKPAPQPQREIVGLSARDMSLIGVFGSTAQKRALIRLPNGSVRKVRAGDRLEGGRIIAVGSDSVRFSERGQETILRLPQ